MNNLTHFTPSTCPALLVDLFSYVQGGEHSTDWSQAAQLKLIKASLDSKWTWWLSSHGLRCCSNLKILEIKSNSFGDEGLQYLSQNGLPHCPLLSHLALNENHFGDEGLKFLSQDGLQHCCLLTYLQLAGNNFGDEGLKILCAEGLQHCLLLTHLALAGNKFGDEGLKSLSQHGLLHCTFLTHLQLSGNKFGAPGLTYLSKEGLQHCRRLAYLGLSGNNFGDEGLKYLSQEGLQHCPLITTLWLSNNGFGDEGLKYLSQDGLQHCPLLTTLKLSNNGFRDEGLKDLSRDGLPHCPLLAHLDLDGNNFIKGKVQSTQQGGMSPSSWSIFGARTEPPKPSSVLELCRDWIAHSTALVHLHGVELRDFTEELGIPIEFKMQDNDNILIYLRQQHKDVRVRVSRVKVMVVGPGEAGKTTLAYKLRENKFSAGQYKMTDGVEMHDWEHGSVNFQLWDFGGQEVYFNTHAMFFENRSVYLIMWNARQLTGDKVLRKLDEYFQNVQNRAPDAPILLVSTHAEECLAMPTECLEEVRAKYPTVLGYHHIDSQSGKGIDDLKARLVEVALQQPYVTQPIPSQYLRAEKALTSMRCSARFSITKAEFAHILLTVQLGLDQEKVLLPLLDQWGVVHVLSGGDIVLQPQRLAEVMSCVITATPAGEAIHGGILNHKDMHVVWSKYAGRLRPQFLDLLHQSELAFPLYDSDGAALCQSLVPAMLPSTEATADEMARELYSVYNENTHGKIEISFSAKATTFFPKLQARLRSMATRDGAWKLYYFVCVEDTISEEISSALLCSNPTGNKIEIHYPLCNDQACAAVLRAVRTLLDEQFQTLSITEVVLLFASKRLNKAALLTSLLKDRNAVCTDKDNDQCTASLAPLRVLLTELDYAFTDNTEMDPTFLSDISLTEHTPPQVNIPPPATASAPANSPLGCISPPVALCALLDIPLPAATTVAVKGAQVSSPPPVAAAAAAPVKGAQVSSPPPVAPAAAAPVKGAQVNNPPPAAAAAAAPVKGAQVNNPPPVTPAVKSTHRAARISELDVLFGRVREVSVSRSDITDLSLYLLKSIPEISRRCELDTHHVRVIWLAMVDKTTGGDKSYLVPISPGRSAADPWMPVYEARIECKGPGHALSPLQPLDDTLFASTLLDSLYQLAIPDKLHYWPGNCEWTGLVKMGGYKGALIEAQMRHFKKIENTEGIEVLIVNQEAICKMPSLDNLRVILDRIASDVTTTKKDVGITKKVQQEIVFKRHEMPLLVSVTQPSATTMRGYFQRLYAKVFMLHFMCPVCGRRGTGYRLVRTSKEVATLAEYVKYTLKAIEIISLVTPVPLPYLSHLSQYLPSSDLIKDLGLAEALRQTQQMVDINLEGLSIRKDTRHNRPVSEVEMTLAEVHRLMALLPTMKESVPPLRTGLHPVFYKKTHCAWVCEKPYEDEKGKVVLDCTKRFKECGNDCLQIKVKTV